jgi:hypothetical protein
MGAMSLYRFLILVSSLLLASMDILAMPEEPPPHSLSPTLNGLNIATLVKKDRAKLMLYVINHEKFPVLCDAQYKSGPEKSDQPQITIPAGKADFFKFNYGRHGDDILLELVCVDPRKQADPHHEAPASQETPNAAPGETPADDTP